MEKFTFGSDPEFMLIDQKGNCKSAIGIVPGKSKKRMKIGRHEYFYDNVFAECAIFPGSCKKEVIYNFRECFKSYAKIVSPYILVPQASQIFPESELQSKDAFKAGCDPETCAYSLEESQMDDDVFLKTNLRTAGGHIHIGHPILQNKKNKPENHYNRIFMARMLDLFLGIPSIFINTDKTEKRRKKIYGRAGRYRDRDHGVEYRTLSNFWLSSPNIVSLIYDICQFTLNFVIQEKHWDFWKVDFEKLRDDSSWEDENFSVSNCHTCHGYDIKSLKQAIDKMDKNAAEKFLVFIGEIMPKKLYNSILFHTNNPVQYDFYKEWGIC
jgi:hypothetical protein